MSSSRLINASLSFLIQKSGRAHCYTRVGGMLAFAGLSSTNRPAGIYGKTASHRFKKRIAPPVPLVRATAAETCPFTKIHIDGEWTFKRTTSQGQQAVHPRQAAKRYPDQGAADPPGYMRIPSRTS